MFLMFNIKSMKYIPSILIFFVIYFILTEIFEFKETASIILSLIGSALFYNSRQDRQVSLSHKNTGPSPIDTDVTKNDNQDDGEYGFVNIFNSKPRKGTEAYRIHEEVEKKKNLAKEKKVDELISDLYFNDIRYYPSWIKHENREYVPALITSATESKKGEDKMVQITLNKKIYKFSFKESFFYTPDGESNTHGLLELFEDDKKVLAVKLSCDYSEYGSDWRPFEIEAFINGEWIEDFSFLKKEKQKDEKDRAIKNAEDPEKIKRMKNNFGIE